MRKIIYTYKGERISRDGLAEIIEQSRCEQRDKYDENHKSKKCAGDNNIEKGSKRKGPVLTHNNTNIEKIEIESILQRLGNEKLIEMIQSHKNIAKSTLAACDFTALLRIASLRNENDTYLYPVLVEGIQKGLGVRPLPIKMFTYNALTKEKSPITFFDHQIGAIEHIRKREEMAVTTNIVGTNNNNSGVSCLHDTPSNAINILPYCNSTNIYGLRGSIVKLEMGLGKTLTAIAASLLAPKPSYDTPHGEKGFPTLIVASKMVMIMWKRDGFNKFFRDDVKVLYFHPIFMNTNAINTLSRKEIVKYDFVVTSYDIVCSAARQGDIWKDICELGDEHTLMKGKIAFIHERTRSQADVPETTGKQILFHTPWERVICDESQRFANPTTFTFKAMMNLYGRFKLCLTGTPMRNYDTDIWAQLRFCGYTGTMRALEWKKRGSALMKLHNLNAAILSVDYKDTLIKLPPKKYYDHPITLQGTEKVLYEAVIGIARNVYDMMLCAKVTFAGVFALFTRLRQICIAPYLITAESKREKLKGKIRKADELAKTHLSSITEGPLWKWLKERDGEGGIGSAKMNEIYSILMKIPKNEKVLIFSMFTSCLDLLKYKLDKETNNEYVLEQLDGDTPDREKAMILERFDTDETLQALLMTYKVCSEGLNLTSACHVICIEPWWTFAVPRQAEARAWRPGQLKNVCVYNIHCQNTIEDRVLSICEGKKAMIEEFLEGAEPIKRAGLDKYTLGRILGVYK